MNKRQITSLRLPFWTGITDHLHLPDEPLFQLHLSPADVPLEGCEAEEAVAALNTDDLWVACLPVSLQIQPNVEQLPHLQNNLRLLLQAEDCEVCLVTEPAQPTQGAAGVGSLDWPGPAGAGLCPAFPLDRRSWAGWVEETPPSSLPPASPSASPGGAY